MKTPQAETGSRGAVRSRGLTLPELLILIVVVALALALAPAVLGRWRERQYVAAMKAELRNVAVAEASYFYDHRVYAADVRALEARGLETGADAQIRVNEATSIGWSATASHSSTALRCFLFVGGASPVGPATETGTIACG